MFDPRLTEEYQQACQPYAYQMADGELAAMDVGASLWATANQTTEVGAAITKTRHIGCRWGYATLVYEPDSIMFPQAKATGLTVKDWQNLIMVNQFGRRFWNEVDGSHKFFNAAMAYHGDKGKLNGGGPIWAIFDAEAAAREKWNRSRRTSIPTATSSPPTRFPSWRPGSRTHTRRSRWPARRCRKR